MLSEGLLFPGNVLALNLGSMSANYVSAHCAEGSMTRLYPRWRDSVHCAGCGTCAGASVLREVLGPVH